MASLWKFSWKVSMIHFTCDTPLPFLKWHNLIFLLYLQANITTLLIFWYHLVWHRRNINRNATVYDAHFLRIQKKCVQLYTHAHIQQFRILVDENLFQTQGPIEVLNLIVFNFTTCKTYFKSWPQVFRKLQCNRLNYNL